MAASGRERVMSKPIFTLDRTENEIGEYQWFVTDEYGDWIEGPFTTSYMATDALLGMLAGYIEEQSS